MILFLSCFEYNVKVKVILKQTSSYFSSFILCSSGNVPAVSSVDTVPNGCNKKLLEATRQMHVAINMQMSATNSRDAACSALFLLVFPATAVWEPLLEAGDQVSKDGNRESQSCVPKPESQGRVRISTARFWCPGTEINHKALLNI